MDRHRHRFADLLHLPTREKQELARLEAQARTEEIFAHNREMAIAAMESAKKLRAKRGPLVLKEPRHMLSVEARKARRERNRARAQLRPLVRRRKQHGRR